MPSLMASILVDHTTEDDNLVSITITIEGQETEVYFMDRNLWESLEQGIRDGRFFSRWMSKKHNKTKTTSARGPINTRELDVN